jgi:hypothetical protein
MLRLVVAAFALGCALACVPGGEAAPPALPAPPDAGTAAVAAPPPYRLVTDARQTMEWILDPAADVIWDSAGFIITAEGETDLAPTTDEGWEQVRQSAALVAEAGNLLMLPGRAAGPEWVAYAEGLTGAGVLAMAAAEAHDAEALFEAGATLYQVCRGCHEVYMAPVEDLRTLP